jgi:N-acetylated-alpha-linked acidic dipeptidase
LASFEGEELGGLGARAWLRENISSLNSSLIAYLNVVVAGAGSKFHAQGSPLLQNALQLATRGVPPPANNVDYWDGKISTGSGGDANTFQSQCFATLDFGFTPKSGDPVFPYHSLFDSEDWMNAFGDPDREYHKVITSLWLSLATLLADSLVLPILAADYAALMKNMVEGIRSQVQSPSALNLKALQTVIGKFQQACVAHDAYSHSLVLHSSQKLEQNSILNQIKDVNRKYITLERFFADPDKAQEDHDRHLILPGGSYYVKRPAFPKLNELIAEGNWSYAEVCVIVPRVSSLLDVRAC